MWAFAAILSTLVLRSVAAFEWTNSTPVAAGVDITYSNSVRFMFDTDGKQIDAYAAKINCMYNLFCVSLQMLTKRVFGMFEHNQVSFE
jgi:hypothetical protein